MIDLSGKIINDTYIIKALDSENDFMQRWEANAIFSPNSFFFDLVKDIEKSRKIYEHKETLSFDLARIQDIKNAYLLKTIEFGLYEEYFFSVQQKITGKSLLELKASELDFPEDTVVKMMDKLGLCLLSFEYRALTHNLLSEYSIWIPANSDNIGIFYINDTLLSYQLIHSDTSPDSYFPKTPSCFCADFYRDGSFHPACSNDLSAFGAIFYKLITGSFPFEAESLTALSEMQKKGDVDLGLIENDKIREFVSCFFNGKKKFKSIEHMYDNFERTFLNELSGRDMEVSRENTSAQNSIDVYMDYSDEVHENSADLEVVEDVELISPSGELPQEEDDISDQNSKNQKSLRGIVNTVVKTVFGIFRRFGRGTKASEAAKKKSALSSRKATGAGFNINMNTDLPTGDLKHSGTNPDPERLNKLFKDMSSHFRDPGKSRNTNTDLDIDKYNNTIRRVDRLSQPSVSPTIKLENSEERRSSSSEGPSPVVKDIERSTEQKDENPMLDYLLEKSNYVNKEFVRVDGASEARSPESVRFPFSEPSIENRTEIISGNDKNISKEISDRDMEEEEDQAAEEPAAPRAEPAAVINKETPLEEAAIAAERKGIWSAIRNFFRKFFNIFK